MPSPILKSVRLLAPAKINWVLSIRGKRPDDYHELDTIFQALNFGDELILKTERLLECHITCSRPDVPLDDSNLIFRAWRLMAERFSAQATGLQCRLIKKLPRGGGVGGASADAAATLTGLARLWNLRLGRTALEQLAAELGSDCA